MDINYIKSLNPAGRKELLSSDAVAIEEGVKYTKPLTPEEIAFYKDELSSKLILQFDINEEKKNVISGFKKRLETIQKDLVVAREAVRFRAITMEGTLYRLADFDQFMIHTVDADGNLISSRMMKPEERQMRIQAIKQIQTA